MDNQVVYLAFNEKACNLFAFDSSASRGDVIKDFGGTFVLYQLPVEVFQMISTNQVKWML